MSERPIRHLVVAAIDFGTTYSGYAFSFVDEHLKDPLKIYTNNVGIGSQDGLVTQKLPTVVLFNEEGSFDSFGYEAENKYAKLAENGQHVGWKYFRRFKMLLHGRKLKRGIYLRDDQDKKFLALDIFSAAIGCMKRDLLKQIRDRFGSLKEADMLWVLTVPAIWNDSAKQFMREAAIKAGIPDSRLKIALEPEAAALYCQEIALKIEKEESGRQSLSSFRPGDRFILLDLGGGTTDVTAHEVQDGGKIVELVAPSGGPWGSTTVDEEFFGFLQEIFGSSVMKQLKEDPEYKVDSLDLQRIVELKKRSMKPSKSDEIVLRLFALFEIYEKINSQTVTEWISQTEFASCIRRKKDKLHIDRNKILKLFDSPVDSVINHMKSILEDPNLNSLRHIVLVGGFAESEVMKTRVKDAFPQPRYNVIVPPDAQLAVLKGAVIYGFKPDSIALRKMPYTYGISTAVPFDAGVHPASKKVEIDGVYKCEDVFQIFIKAGTTVTPGESFLEKTFRAPVNDSSTANIEIYKTPAREPSYVDEDGCENIGKLTLQLQHAVQGCMINVKMFFGDTELKVDAQEQDTNNRVSATFNFL